MQRPFPAYSGTDPYVFVSYAHSDAARVYPLLQALHAQGINIWYDEGIEPGKSWREELASAIAEADCVLIFVSSASTASRNCLKEINFALSNDRRMALAYLEQTTLPPALELSLGDEQAVHADHYREAEFLNKLALLVSASTSLQLATKRQKKNNTRKWFWAGGIIGVLVLLAIYLMPLLPRAPQEIDAAQTKAIAVAEFANLGGNPDLDWLSSGLAGMISDQLADSSHTAVVSRTRWTNLQKQHADIADLYTAARKTGIRYVVSGEILNSPEGMLLTTRISDLVAGIDVGARTFDGVSADAFVGLARKVTQAVQQSLNLPSARNLETLSADFVASSFAAHQAYVAGLSYYNQFDFDEAVASMQAALQIDPQFHMARARLANIQLSKGEWVSAADNLDQIPVDADLSERERAYIDGLRFMAINDYPSAVTHFSEFIERYPYDVEAKQFLAESHFRNYDAEAAIDVLRGLRQQEPENHHVRASIGYMSMSLERYDDARQAFLSYAELAPDLPHPWELLGSLELRLNNLPEALNYYNKSLDIEPDFALSVLGKARVLALSGNYSEAQALFVSVAEDPQQAARNRITATFDLVALLNVEQRFAEVAPAFERVQALLEREGARLAMSYSERGLAAQRLGNLSEGREFIAQAIEQSPAGGVPTRYLFARGLFELAAEEHESIRATTDAIRSYALPADNPDRTEEVAALYLEGRLLSAIGQHDAAVTRLSEADQLEGYEYRSTKYALANAQRRAGLLEDAIINAELAFTERQNYLAGDLRLDLEMDRRAALELSIALACELKRNNLVQRLTSTAHNQWPGVAATACGN